MKRLLAACFMVVFASGCSSMSAPQVGQTVGGILGSAIAPGVGTTLGSLAGIMAGMVAQGHIDKATEKKEQKVLSEQMSRPAGSQAASTDAAARNPAALGVPTRVWVDETVQGGQVASGRFETRHIQ